MQRAKYNVYDVDYKQEELDRLMYEDITVSAEEYRNELAKELFNFQLVALLKEDGNNRGFIDLYSNEIDNMEITKEEIEKLINREFSKEIEIAIDNMDKGINKNFNNEYDITFINDLKDALKALDEVNTYILKDDYEQAKNYIIRYDLIEKLKNIQVLNFEEAENASIIIKVL